MSMWQTKAVKSKAFPQAPEGPQPAVCVGLVDMGTHVDVYKGKSKDVHKVLVIFELVGGDRDDEGGAFVLAREFNFSFVEGANFRKFIEQWRGKKFADGEDIDILKLLEKKCILTIEHSPPNEDGKYYASINGISPPMKGVEFGEPTHPVLLWAFDMGVPYPNPDWVPRSYGVEVSEIIANAQESRGIIAPIVATPAAMNGAKPSPAGRVAATVADLAAADQDDDNPF